MKLIQSYAAILVIVATTALASPALSQSPTELDPQIQQWTFENQAEPDIVVSETPIDGNSTCSTNMYQDGWLGFDPALMLPMLNFQNSQSDKELILLNYQAQNGCGPRLSLGAQLRASALWGSTNRADKFPYLGRFPRDFTGTSATDARLLQGNLAFAATDGGWVHGYGELLFSDVFSFQSFNQGSLQMRQMYVVLGNLPQSPFYAYIGKKATNFGDMGTLSPFTQSVVWHYFGGLAEGIGVGYSRGGLDLSITGLDGGRGIRVVDSPDIGSINNFAANIRATHWLNANSYLRLGAGFLDGTIYNGNVAEHIDPVLTGPQNGAWDVNAELRLGAFTVAGEYVSTENPWPATAAKVEAYRIEAAYDSIMPGTYPIRWSLSWSEGLQGPAGSEFEFNQQLVIGVRQPISQHAFLTLEYVRSSGFAPLINITRVSDRDVNQDSAVVGLVLSL